MANGELRRASRAGGFPFRRLNSAFRVRGFSLVELMVTIAIIAILATITTLAFRKATEGTILANARNAIVTYAKIARAYAIANRIETMMVVNPFNGRFELWHSNPPVQGGVWDPMSGGTAGWVGGAAGQNVWNDPRHNGMVYAPVFDSGARLPVDGDGVPRVAVNPIDYYDDGLGSYLRPVSSSPPSNLTEIRYMDNLAWAAFCFDPAGQLVVRTRRIATRTRVLRDGSAPSWLPNRLPDHAPDMTLRSSPLSVPNNTLVMGGNLGDSPITSALGFVVSDASKMARVFTAVPSSQALVDQWLRNTREPAQGDPNIAANVSDFADTIVLNRHTAQELAKAR